MIDLHAMDIMGAALERTLERWIGRTWCEPWGKRLPMRAEIVAVPAAASADVVIRVVVVWDCGRWPRGLWFSVSEKLSMRHLLSASSAVRAVRDVVDVLMATLEPEGEPWGTYHPLAEAA